MVERLFVNGSNLGKVTIHGFETLKNSKLLRLKDYWTNEQARISLTATLAKVQSIHGFDILKNSLQNSCRSKDSNTFEQARINQTATNDHGTLGKILGHMIFNLKEGKKWKWRAILNLRQRSYNSLSRIATSHFLKKARKLYSVFLSHRFSESYNHELYKSRSHLQRREFRILECFVWNFYVIAKAMPNNLHAKRVFVHLPFGHNHLSKAQKVKSDVKISKCLQQYLKSSYTSIERCVQTLNANIFNMRLEPAKLYLLPEPSCQNIANASCLLRVYFCLMDKSIKHKF